MVRRLFDIIVSAMTLVCVAPVIALAAVAVKLSSSGSAFYRASRVGKNGQLFTMHKLRTMHCREVQGSSITAATDARVFLAGRILRKLKIDELPQLVNIIRGDMAIVGPRPEAPDIVEQHYTDEYLESLNVAPGLTSPGSVYYYTHGEQVLAEDGSDAEDLYLTRLLPEKMAIDLEYLRRATLLSDVGVILQTVQVLFLKALGTKRFAQTNTEAAGDDVSHMRDAA